MSDRTVQVAFGISESIAFVIDEGPYMGYAQLHNPDDLHSLWICAACNHGIMRMF